MTTVNEIIRFDMGSFARKMDEPDYELHVPGEDSGYEAIRGEKIYYVNFLIQLRHEGNVDYRRFRLMITQDGIREIQKM